MWERRACQSSTHHESGTAADHERKLRCDSCSRPSPAGPGSFGRAASSHLVPEACGDHVDGVDGGSHRHARQQAGADVDQHRAGWGGSIPAVGVEQGGTVVSKRRCRVCSCSARQPVWPSTSHNQKLIFGSRSLCPCPLLQAHCLSLSPLSPLSLPYSLGGLREPRLGPVVHRQLRRRPHRDLQHVGVHPAVQPQRALRLQDGQHSVPEPLVAAGSTAGGRRGAGTGSGAGRT